MEKTGPKRTKEQRFADLAWLEKEMMQRGASTHELARRLNAIRDYTITHNQIAHDQKKLRERFKALVDRNIEAAKGLELRKLQEQEVELWEAWNRSKGEVTETSLRKRNTGAPEEKKEGDAEKPAPGQSETLIKKKTQYGDPAIMGRLLEIAAMRQRLLGLVTERVENVGPDGEAMPAPAQNVTVNVNAPIPEGVMPDELVEQALRKFYGASGAN